MTSLREKQLAGKAVLVTGGPRGIGAAIARRLVSDGANAAITYTKGADAAAADVRAIQGAVVWHWRSKRPRTTLPRSRGQSTRPRRRSADLTSW